MTDTTTLQRVQNQHDSIRATVGALINHFGGDSHIVADTFRPNTLSGVPFWQVVAILGRRRLTVTGGHISTRMTFDKRSVETPATSLHAVTTELVVLVLGKRSIPAPSRKAVKVALQYADDDPRKELALGLRRFARDGFPAHWLTLDIPTQWELISEAAAQEHGHPFTYLNLHARMDVPLDVLDIYQDAYFENVHRLMAQFDWGLARRG